MEIKVYDKFNLIENVKLHYDNNGNLRIWVNTSQKWLGQHNQGGSVEHSNYLYQEYKDNKSSEKEFHKLVQQPHNTILVYDTEDDDISAEIVILAETDKESELFNNTVYYKFTNKDQIFGIWSVMYSMNSDTFSVTWNREMNTTTRKQQ